MGMTLPYTDPYSIPLTFTSLRGRTSSSDCMNRLNRSLQACVYTCTYTRTHTWTHAYTHVHTVYHIYNTFQALEAKKKKKVKQWMESVYPRHASRIGVRKVEIWEHLTEPTHSVEMVSVGAELTMKTSSFSAEGPKHILMVTIISWIVQISKPKTECILVHYRCKLEPSKTDFLKKCRSQRTDVNFCRTWAQNWKCPLLRESIDRSKDHKFTALAMM